MVIKKNKLHNKKKSKYPGESWCFRARFLLDVTIVFLAVGVKPSTGSTYREKQQRIGTYI